MEIKVKSHGTMEGVYINGAPQGITFHETDEFTLYPASIISVNKNRFTKHYFIGSKRIASRIGSGHFNNVYGMNGCNITAGQQDYAERLNQIESQKEDYYRELGIAPGIPTMKGSYGDPENTGVGYNTIIRNLGDHSVPTEWKQYVKHNEDMNSAPGAPIAWDKPTQPEEVQPGYDFIPENESTEETFYYHSDHLGSTSYVTDDSARITQYTAYLPYGELLVDEHTSSEDMPYKFNGKELDEETGLYYYGARYMQPITSVWYGIDPLTEKYPDVSAYAYCMGNPVKLVDSDGRKVLVFSSKLPVDTNDFWGSLIHDNISIATHTFVAVFNEKNELLQYYSFGPANGNLINSDFEINSYPSIFKDKSSQIYRSDYSIIKAYQDGTLSKNDFYKEHVEIKVPENMTPDEFDKKVIKSGKDFGNSPQMKYVLNPKRKTTGNCNKGSYNLLKHAGVDEKYLKEIGDNKLSGFVWGWGKDMPWTKKEQEDAQKPINRLSEYSLSVF